MTAAACLLEYRDSVQKIESYIAAAHTMDGPNGKYEKKRAELRIVL